MICIAKAHGNTHEVDSKTTLKELDILFNHKSTIDSEITVFFEDLSESYLFIANDWLDLKSGLVHSGAKISFRTGCGFIEVKQKEKEI